MKINPLYLLLTAILSIPLMAESTKPNILIIVADDLGYADLSFLSQSPADVHTPAIDSLAAQGTYFSNAYATSPICSPSRCGLITGRYQQRWGNYWFGDGGLPPTELTLPQALAPSGYLSKKIGKTHLNGGPVEHPLDHGFDESIGFMFHTWDYIRLSEKDVEAYRKKGVKDFGCQVVGPLIRGRDQKVSYENGFSTEIFTDEAIELIRRDRNGRPFYIELEYNAVHAPIYVVPQHYAQKVGVEFIPFDRNAQQWQFPYWEPTREPHTVFHEKWGLLGEVIPDGRKRYIAQLMALDDNIGRLLETLDQTDQRNDTLVVFLSDNGGTINTYSNNTPLRGWKYMYGEGGVRIPIIVSYPKRLPINHTSEALVSAMDIFPTVLELADIDIPANVDGLSLIPLLKGRLTQQHDHLVWSYGRNDSWTVRKGPWKLAHNIGWRHSNYKIVEEVCVRDENEIVYPGGILLFDLEQDISEQKNLADQYPEVVRELTGLYEKWEAQMSPPRTGDGTLKVSNTPQPLTIQSMLKKLGATIKSNIPAADGNQPEKAIDGNLSTIWHTPWTPRLPFPHELIIELNSPQSIRALTYYPRQDMPNGRCTHYQIFASNDGRNWGQPLTSGTLENSAAKQMIRLPESVETQFLKFVSLESATRKEISSAAEIDIILDD